MGENMLFHWLKVKGRPKTKYTLYCFPAKKGVEKQKSAKEAWKQPIFAKISTNLKNSL